MTLEVDLHINDHSNPAPDLALFQKWVATAIAASDQPLTNNTTVSIVVTNKSHSAELNLSFRQKEGPTNVLSFPDTPIPGGNDTHLGDIILCNPVVVEEAEKQGIPTMDHWAHLTIHGILHLLGYDHINDDEALIMERIEIDALSQLNIASPY